VYRGLIASAWVGRESCNWLRHAQSHEWYEEVQSHSGAADFLEDV
jgi:hypothetical protein